MKIKQDNINCHFCCFSLKYVYIFTDMVLILIKLNAVNNLLLYNLYENYINYYFLFQYILLYNNINDKKMTSTTIAEVIFLYYLSISPLHGWLILLQVRTTLHKPTNTFTMRCIRKHILQYSLLHPISLLYQILQIND